MALTRRFLSALDIESDKIDEIINAHVETVDGLKEERDTLKKEAEANADASKKLPEIQKELEELKAQGNGLFETKYNEMKEEHDKIKAEFEQYKADIEASETKRTKEAAYRDLLRESKISDKRIDKILKVSDLDTLELDKDGKLKDIDKLKKSIEEDWGDFIVEETQTGASTATPPKTSTQVPKGESRAAKIAAQYHSNLYGDTTQQGGENK